VPYNGLSDSWQTGYDGLSVVHRPC